MKFMKKIFVLVLLVGMLISPGLIPEQAFADEGINKVTVTLYGDPSTEMGFTWYTPATLSQNSDLEIIDKSGSSSPNFDKALTFSGTSFVSTNSPEERVHKVEATGLKANKTYYYRVGDASINLWSDMGTFQTAPKNSAFTFIDMADPQAKTAEEADLATETIAKAYETVDAAKFLALNGDWVDKGNVEIAWNWLLDGAQDNLLHTTILPVAGNHEEQLNSFIEHFDIDAVDGSDTTTGAYYSVDYSNAHLIVLNNNEDSAEYADFTPEQIEWLKEDVASARANSSEWIIVLMHKGPYTTSNHATDSDIMGDNGVRTLVAPIMEELGVDLVLQGHDHIYARSKPINSNGTAEPVKTITKMFEGKKIDYAVKPQGTVYLIPGTAGPKVYYKNKTIDPSYYDLFDVADENHAASYGPDPSDPSRPVRSQIQNFESITVDNNQLTVISYEIDQSRNDAQPYIIDEFGIIK